MTPEELRAALARTPRDSRWLIRHGIAVADLPREARRFWHWTDRGQRNVWWILPSRNTAKRRLWLSKLQPA